LDTTVGALLVKFLTVIQAVPAAVGTLVTDSNSQIAQLFAPLDSTVGAVLVKFLTAIQALPGEVGSMVTTTNNSLTPLFTPLTSTIYPKLQTSTANTFAAITNIVGIESKKVGPLYTTAGNAIGTGLAGGAARGINALQGLAQQSSTTAGRIGQAFQSAAAAVGNALKSMQSRASSTFSSISSSAGNASSSVNRLANAINSLKNKTVTITTVYVTRHVVAAKGFGPAVVSNATNLTVGEAGPELVSVIPLAGPNAISKNLSAPQSITNNTSASNSSNNISNTMLSNSTGVRNIVGGNNTSNSMMSSNMASVSNGGGSSSSVINKFNDSVSRITNMYDRQESRMMTTTSNIQNVSSVRNGGGAFTSSTMGGDINTTNIPNISNVRGGNVYNAGGGGAGGSPIEGIVAMVKDIISTAFGQTTINLTSQSIMDSDVVYEKQKKQFGLRNGAMLK
jgi:hypothetical protein